MKPSQQIHTSNINLQDRFSSLQDSDLVTTVIQVEADVHGPCDFSQCTITSSPSPKRKALPENNKIKF